MTKHYCDRCGKEIAALSPGLYGLCSLKEHWPIKVGPASIPIGTLTVKVGLNTEDFEAALARVEPALRRLAAAVKALSETPIEVAVGKASPRQSPETRA